MQTAKESAESGLNLLKSAITDFIKSKPDGVTNSEIAKELNINSDYEGTQKDYLSWSIIGILLKEGNIFYKTKKNSNRKLYFHK